MNEKGEIVEKVPGEAKYFTENLGNGITLEMVRIPSGKFLMGAAEGEEGASDDEYPQHEVTVPEFWMGKVAVTQSQWAAVAELSEVERDIDKDPARFKGAQRPVERVSWEEAMEFCRRLTERTKRKYTLPSEAQWEYACRAGTTTPFYFGPTITADLANYDGNSTYANAPKGRYRQATTEVDNFQPNTFGLHGMYGNVWEWCLDIYHDSYKNAPVDESAWLNSEKKPDAKPKRVLRGGAWCFKSSYCRSSCRGNIVHLDRDNSIGFRLVSPFPRRL